MNISFDFDGTLTDERIREMCLTLMKQHHVIILTSRWKEDLKDVWTMANAMGIKEVHSTNHRDKADYMNDNNLQMDVHFDDDFFEIDAIQKRTKALGILVDFTLHPSNTEITVGGLIVPKDSL